MPASRQPPLTSTLAAILYTHDSTVALIESRFPALADDLHDEIVEGLLHLQMAEFSRLAQAAIDSSDHAVWSQVTDTFMDLWQHCDDAVQNALNVSFLEHLSFKDQKVRRRWAFEAMPETMRKAWQAMDQYNKRLHGG